MNPKKINTKNCYFNDITKIKDFDFDNILIDKKSHENVLNYKIPCKTLISAKPTLHIRFNKKMDLLEFITELDIL